MGVPAFYRWLVTKYPKAVVKVIEETPISVNGVEIPVDSSGPNPNGMEFDNLYLDLNGIIHPCFHPEGMAAPKSNDEVFKAVFKYVDRVFTMIRPRKLLFMAIDGVAPRAKLNQQRTRRFRAAKDAELAAAENEKLKSLFESEGAGLSVLEDSKTMDSNIITPGTKFMASLSLALKYYIHLRMNTDPGWRGIKVILSDATVPGEGEHKIMSYIRLQRNLPGFNPNTRHCLYGLDADLIMLALTTHEIHFSILREDVRPQMSESKGGPKHLGNKGIKCGLTLSEDSKDYISQLQFQFLNIWVLRDYLQLDLAIPTSNGEGEADLERLIDDFVFMCIFVGNDFLPHVPSLDIIEGAIDLLMAVYKKEFVKMGGYLTNSFEVNLERVEYFVRVIGSHENAIFNRRSQKRNFSQAERWKSGGPPNLHRTATKEGFWSSFDITPSSTHPALESSGPKEIQSFVPSVAPDTISAVIDNVKLGEEGWKERYYAEKFEAKTKDEHGQIQRHAVLKYIEGICWVMRYYYQGVCSWQWFYPYHYAPFASDFYGLGELEIHFTLGEPFKPFDQLMGVLPAASAHALPLCYRKLMTDPSSPILDLYPTDFELDLNGKHRLWMAVCKLPFIEETRLLTEVAKVEHTLTDEEKQRNSLGIDVLFVHILHPLAAEIFSFCKRNKDHPKLSTAKVKRKIDPKLSGGMNGFIYISDKPVWPLEIYSHIEDMEIITTNKVISVFYRFPTSHLHIPRPPEGVVIPKSSVTKKHIGAPLLWHDESSILGQEISKSYIPDGISGSCLSKLAHRLVKEYCCNKQNIVGNAELEFNLVVDPTLDQSQNIVGHAERDFNFAVDPASCWSNSKEMVHRREADDEKSYMNEAKPWKKKSNKKCNVGKKLWDRLYGDKGDDDHSIKCQSDSNITHMKEGDESQNIVGLAEGDFSFAGDPTSYQSNSIEMDHKKEALKRKSMDVELTECDVNFAVDPASSWSNSKGMVHTKEADDERGCMNEEKPWKKKRRGKNLWNRDKGDGHSIKCPSDLNITQTKEVDESQNIVGHAEHDFNLVGDPTSYQSNSIEMAHKKEALKRKNNDMELECDVNFAVDPASCWTNSKEMVHTKEADDERGCMNEEKPWKTTHSGKFFVNRQYGDKGDGHNIKWPSDSNITHTKEVDDDERKRKSMDVVLAERDVNIAVDPASCCLNSKVTVHTIEADDEQSYMNEEKPLKKKRRGKNLGNRPYGDKGDGHSIKCPSDSNITHTKEGLAERDVNIAVDPASCCLNSKETVHKKEADDEKSCMNEEKPWKKKRRGKNLLNRLYGDKGDGHSIKCPSDSNITHTEEVDDDERSCTDGTNPGKKKLTGGGDDQSIEYQLKSKEIVHEKQVIDDEFQLRSKETVHERQAIDDVCQLNLKEVHVKEEIHNEGSCMDGVEPGKRKHSDTGDIQSIECQLNSKAVVREREVVHDDRQLNSKEIICEKEVIDDERSCGDGAKPEKNENIDAGEDRSIEWQLKLKNLVREKQVIDDECQLNSKDLVHETEQIDDEKSCMDGAQPGKTKHTDAGDGQSIECQLQSKEMVHQKQVIDADCQLISNEVVDGERSNIDGAKAQKRQHSDTGDIQSVECQLNPKEIVLEKEVVDDESSQSTKRKKRRKSKKN